MSDLHDREVRNALWQASGDDCDTTDALLRVEARVRRIRRRRMDIFGVSLLVALVVTLGIASRSHDDPPRRPTSVVTATPPSPVSDVTTAAPATAPPTTAAPSSPADSAIPVPAGAAPPDAAAAPITESPPPDTAADEVAADGSADPSADPPASQGQQDTAAAPPAPAPASTHAPRPQQQTFSAPGGRLTVAVADGGLTLVSASARTGYEAQAPTASAASVEVEFRSRWGSSRIHVDLVDGRLVPTITNDASGLGGDDHGRRSGRTTTTTAAPSSTADSSSSRSGGYEHRSN